MEAISHTDEKWLDLLCMERLCLMPFSPVKILTSNVVNYGEFCLIQKDSDSCDLIKSVTAQVMNLFFIANVFRYESRKKNSGAANNIADACAPQ